ncbi:MAG: 50S ribosomal protein L21 [Candidatus Kapabacteria bacterium]|nr:50S ribosomal protein L21 [Candidatus Kapabacteria bacterium]
MTALVEIAGSQFVVAENDMIVVPLLAGNPDDTVQFTNILATVEGDASRIGAPYISGSVSAKILEHGKGDKILVFKKKRRKGYQKMNGHRQKFTKIQITNVSIA